MKSLFALVLAISSLKVALNEAAFTVVKWNKRIGEFVPFFTVTSVQTEREEQFLQSRQKETRNFNGQPLHMMYYEEVGFFHFYDNDTKISGITGNIWTTLSELLNFTLVVTNVKGGTLGITFPNGTYGGILEYARLNQTDVIPQMSVYITRYAAVEFTPNLWTTSQRIFAYDQWKRNRFWMIRLFSTEIWCIFCAFIGLLSFSSRVTQIVLIRHRGRKLQSQSYFNHLFYTYSTVCNQGNTPDNTGSGSRILSFPIRIFSWLTLIGNTPDNTGSGSRILSFTISIFSWLILIAYSSHLIYSMGQEVFNAPFNDLESLLSETNFQIVVLKGSVADITFSSVYTMPIFARVKNSSRLKVVSNLEDLYREVCSNSNKYVMFDSEDSVAARGAMACRLIPVGVAYYVTPIASGISRRVKHKKTIDIGILKLREYGVVDAIKKRYIAPEARGTAIRHPDSLAIDMERVSVIFGILCLGIVASIAICAAENIIFSWKKRMTVKTGVRRFPTIKQIVSRLYRTITRMYYRIKDSVTLH